MRRLLDQLAGHLGRRPRYENVLIHRNIGGVTGDSKSPDDHLSWRGFNLCILDDSGTPSYYVKCRPSASRRALREASLLELLGRSERFRFCVPDSSAVELEGLRVIIMRYVRGQRIATTLSRLDTASCLSLIRSVVTRCREMMVYASGLRLPLDRTWISDLSRWRHVIEGSIVRFQIDADMMAELERCVESASSLPSALQHGDLTVQNAMLERGQIVLLDFEAVGESTMPLFDLWHLLRSADGAISLRHNPGAWWQGQYLRLVAETAEELHLEQRDAWATLPVYLLQNAVWLARRGVPQGYVDPYMKELGLVLQQRLRGATVNKRRIADR